MHSFVVRSRPYKQLRTSWRFRIFSGISVVVTDLSKPAISKQRSIATLVSFKKSGRITGILLLLELPFWSALLPLNLSLGADFRNHWKWLFAEPILGIPSTPPFLYTQWWLLFGTSFSQTSFLNVRNERRGNEPVRFCN